MAVINYHPLTGGEYFAASLSNSARLFTVCLRKNTWLRHYLPVVFPRSLGWLTSLAKYFTDRINDTKKCGGLDNNCRKWRRRYPKMRRFWGMFCIRTSPQPLLVNQSPRLTGVISLLRIVINILQVRTHQNIGSNGMVKPDFFHA